MLEWVNSKGLAVGLDSSSQVGQSGLLGPPTLNKWVELAPLHVCPQGWFTLVSVEEWGSV